MKEIEINVLWQSKRKFNPGTIHYNNLVFNLISADSEPTLRVFDTRSYSDFSSAAKAYKIVTVPSLVISSDNDTAKWLRKLNVNDEICLESRVESDLNFNITRLAVRSYEWARYFKRSFHDALTGLMNRAELQRRLDLELTEASPEAPVSLLMADVDHLKIINDHFSHAIGDSVLRAISKVLLNSIMNENSAYRLGGDEFALIVRMNSTQAKALAEFICQEVVDYDYNNIAENISPTISIGIATNLGDLDYELFVLSADKALYQAKAEGRNRVISAGDRTEGADEDPAEAMIIDFENRIKVLTDRLTSALSLRSRQMITQLKREADYDGLTGLFNRRYFDRRMAREFDRARTSGQPLSMIFIDIDHFGKVNKTYGFPTGDRTLQMVTQLIKDTIRTVDWTGRYGGEELCVVLPDTTEEQAYEVAERVWKIVGSSDAEAYDGRKVNVTLSIGVAQLSDEDDALLDFIQRTGNRTRYAKEHGRNQICCRDRELT